MSEAKILLKKVIKGLNDFQNDLEIKKWNSFKLDFSPALKDKKEVRNKIKNNVEEKTGFYAIYEGEACLYIGIGRPIWKRLESHYLESKGKDLSKRWIKFFEQYKGKILNIYWKEFNLNKDKKIDDKARILIEAILTYVIKPKFEE